MRKIIIIGLVLSLALIAGCKQAVETTEPAGKVSLVQIMLEGSEKPAETGVVSKSVRFVANQLDPEEITVQKGNILELTIESDREAYFSFPAFDTEEKLVKGTPVTLRIPLAEKGSFDFYCIRGCSVPVTGQIKVQ